ncbi:MAG: hypothetical protein AAFW75_05740 [Cyanobacteria bacterium J06636_16]
MAKVKVVAQRLADLDEAELTVQLGALSQYVEANPKETAIADFETIPVPRGAFDDLLKSGKSVFSSVSPKT